ncbi:MAG TPA: 5-(carboxyamino)imidazole ribonucleotide synthase [Gemmatimonadaceae bacterium]|nr:5-(carboxyamino)imidazole ribonucleotide synthase [Gemmatimonadaceae bacterium]
MTVIPPGATIGILGGGQLGRMTAQAARAMGYSVHALDPDPDCPARGVVDRLVTAAFNDADAAADLARHCDVITLEIEQIAPDSLEAAARLAPVRPAPHVIATIQDRGRQKRWLRQHGFPLGDYRDVHALSDLEEALVTLGPCFVKSCHGGYDGRSQVRVDDPALAHDAWRALGERAAVAEQALDLEAELSVMVARRPSGQVVAYPPALNHHTRQVLSWSVLPAPLPPEIATEATRIARGIAETFGLEGVIGVEMFLTRDGRVLVNELAPRPHNSYHASESACAVSQFEQLVRAACDLPLGDGTIIEPAAIVNLFGELWADGEAPPFAQALEQPGVRLHLYGKKVARPGRKMGHLSATGATPEQALAHVRAAAARIGLHV